MEVCVRSFRDMVEIYIDGERVFKVEDGKDEDNILNRNFWDCHKIKELLERAFDAGKRGGRFIIKEN